MGNIEGLVLTMFILVRALGEKVRLMHHIPFQDCFSLVMLCLFRGFADDLLYAFVQCVKACRTQVNVKGFCELTGGCDVKEMRHRLELLNDHIKIMKVKTFGYYSQDQ